MGFVMLPTRTSSARAAAEPVVMAIRSLTFVTTLIVTGIACAGLVLLVALPDHRVGWGAVGAALVAAVVRLHRNHAVALTGIVAGDDRGRAASQAPSD